MARRSTDPKLLCTLLILLLCVVQQARGHGGIDHGDGGDEDSGTTTAPAAALRSSKGLVAVKSYCLVILLVFTFAGGVSPYFCRWNETFLLLGTQFAAGIFLGTALMHFLAGSSSTFHGLTENHYPFSYMLACAGFMFTMLADCAVAAAAAVAIARRRQNQRAVVNEEEELGHGGRRLKGEEEEGGAGNGAAAAAASPAPAAAADGDAHQLQQHPVQLVAAAASFEDAVLLIVALCFHSVFEGIAIGVSATKDEAWRNLWTIGLHKIFAAVAMGIALLRMIPKRPFLMTVLYSLAFAVSSPIGVGIGIAIDATTEGLAADWTYAISMGIATGVFVYVAVNHLMAKGYRPQQPNYFDKPIFKFLSALLGIAVMAIVMIWD